MESGKELISQAQTIKIDTIHMAMIWYTSGVEYPMRGDAAHTIHHSNWFDVVIYQIVFCLIVDSFKW